MNVHKNVHELHNGIEWLRVADFLFAWLSAFVASRVGKENVNQLDFEPGKHDSFRHSNRLIKQPLSGREPLTVVIKIVAVEHANHRFWQGD